VIVDLAAERGGNCELTRPGETVTADDVTILGPLNLASEIPKHASQMYSNNLTTFLTSLIKDGTPVLDMTDECIAGTLVTKDGQAVHPTVRDLAGTPPAAASSPPPQQPSQPPPPSHESPSAKLPPVEEEPTDTFRLSDD
jgi:NAD(P) transhydrogenase subunit alpha